MTRIFIPTSGPSDWRRLLASPDLHWKKGYSARTTAECWEGAGGRLPGEIRDLFRKAGQNELKDLELILAIPEWKVKLKGGSRASQTDVLALARNGLGLVAISVEAKVNEAFGPTLGEKRAEASIGQMERIDYLHEVMGLDTPLRDEIRYQLLHRTGAALLTAQQFHAGTAVMLVHSFSPVGQWREDFDDFCAAVSAETVSEDLFVVKHFDQPKLFIAWCKGNEKYLGREG